MYFTFETRLHFKLEYHKENKGKQIIIQMLLLLVQIQNPNGVCTVFIQTRVSEPLHY